jgi:hypothetical protein
VLALLVEPVLLPVNKPGNCKTKTWSLNFHSVYH